MNGWNNRKIQTIERMHRVRSFKEERNKSKANPTKSTERKANKNDERVPLRKPRTISLAFHPVNSFELRWIHSLHPPIRQTIERMQRVVSRIKGINNPRQIQRQAPKKTQTNDERVPLRKLRTILLAFLQGIRSSCAGSIPCILRSIGGEANHTTLNTRMRRSNPYLHATFLYPDNPVPPPTFPNQIHAHGRLLLSHSESLLGDRCSGDPPTLRGPTMVAVGHQASIGFFGIFVTNDRVTFDDSPKSPKLNFSRASQRLQKRFYYSNLSRKVQKSPKLNFSRASQRLQKRFTIAI